MKYLRRAFSLIVSPSVAIKHKEVTGDCKSTVDDHVGVFTYRDGTLARIETPNGFIDSEGEIYYYVKDYQSNIRQVTDADGAVLQDNHYYPYGMLMAESSDILAANLRSTPSLLSPSTTTAVSVSNPYLYGGKEYLTFKGSNYLDFSARVYDNTTLTFGTPDPLRDDYTDIHAHLYCAGNPVMFFDPSGCLVEGVTKEDAAMLVNDFRAMFPGEEFKNFIELIVRSGNKQKGRSLATISDDALSLAFRDITLDEFQQALVDIVVSTINSDNIHKVEYISDDKEISSSSLEVYGTKLRDWGLTDNDIESMGGYYNCICLLYGGASTVPTQNGSLTLISKTEDKFTTNRRFLCCCFPPMNMHN